MNLLAALGEEKCVSIIFDLIQNLPKNSFGNLENMIYDRLFKPEWQLYEKYKEIIMKKILAMIKDKDPIISERGIKLEKAKQSRRNYA